MKKPYYLFRINAGFREEICWWLDFIDSFNCKAKMLGQQAPFVPVYSDASDWGLGATFKDDWLIGTFLRADAIALSKADGHHMANPSTECIGADINVREMGAIICAANSCPPPPVER